MNDFYFNVNFLTILIFQWSIYAHDDIKEPLVHLAGFSAVKCKKQVRTNQKHMYLYPAFLQNNDFIIIAVIYFDK